MNSVFNKIAMLISLILFVTPVFADCILDSGAEFAGIYALNKLVRQDNLKEQLTYLPEESKQINEILTSNKSEKFTKEELKIFGLNCMCRNERLINDFREKYFLPSYKTYQSFDSIHTVSFEDWISEASLNEKSNLHEYYKTIKQNYNDCKKIYMLNQ